MATAAQRKKKRKLSKLDLIGLAMLIALIGGLLYAVDQRGKQAATEPAAVLPATVLNATGGSGDANGRDLNTVPRYPGSRRLLYTEQDSATGKVYSLMYSSPDDLSVVSAYYENEMPKYGWQMVVKSEQALRMDFVRHDATTAIGVPEVAINFAYASSGNTTIAIVATEPKKQ